MLRYNLLMIYRNFKRHKGTFFINLVGLSAGLTGVLLIYLWVNDELHVDKFHQNDRQLVQVLPNYQNPDGIETGDSTPGLLAETLAEEMPEVKYASATRLLREDQTLTANNTNVKAAGQYASPDYFNVFSYDLVLGYKDKVLTDKNSIVLSEKLAVNLFGGTEDVVGKVVQLDHKKPFQIAGVFKDVPANSSVQFDYVLPYEILKEENNLTADWNFASAVNYLVLKEGTDIDKFNAKIAGFVKSKAPKSTATLFVQPYSDRYLYGDYENGVQAGGRIEYVRLFSIIALFILVIACINFTNLSTAKASRRLKEVGVKKALGAKRRTLVQHFLGESLLMTLISLVVAILVVWLLLPSFNDLTGKQLALNFDVRLWLSVLGFTLLAGLLAGSYPAFYLTGFNTALVMKGKINSSLGEMLTRKGLVVFQFTMSIILIISVLVVYKQIDFLQSKNLGYDRENIIHLPIEGKVAENLDTFLDEVQKLPGVVGASSTGENMVGGNNSWTIDKWEGKDPTDKTSFAMRPVNYGMLDLLKVELKAGRDFSETYGTEEDKIIFNQAAIDYMGLEDPVGKQVFIGDFGLEIIGVTKDFHFESLHEKVAPLFFVLRPGWTKMVIVKIAPGQEKQVLAGLENFYKNFNPGFPLDFQFLDDDYQAQYVSERRVATLARDFGGLAILISCLGLFGLATFNAERRTKEIGVRKVLGASVASITALLSKDFLVLVFIALLIAAPVAWYLLHNWLAGFAFHIDMQWWMFALAGSLSIAIALLTVSFQAVKAAVANPVESLRSE